MAVPATPGVAPTFAALCGHARRRDLIILQPFQGQALSYVVICAVALFASGLTFFSGFGLGTLLLPAFALFFPVEQAIALTAVVHFLNSLFKLILVGRHVDRHVVLRFGVPAIVASFAGAWVLLQLAATPAVARYEIAGRPLEVTPVGIVVGLLLLAFALIEIVPRLRDLEFGARLMPVGGVLSGFFGGLSGMQGALRSAFLARAGLSKEAFIGSGVAIAALVDLTRLGVYATYLRDAPSLDYAMLAAAVLAAFAGALAGSRLLPRLTMPGIQRIVSAMLVIVALGLMSGIL
jgi:hypothetical protein